MIEHPEPGGVNCTTRKVITGGEVGIQPPAQHLVEAIGPIDVRDGQPQQLRVHVSDS